jgi:alpha-tubulin suppressor-like RCC1 family protein
MVATPQQVRDPTGAGVLAGLRHVAAGGGEYGFACASDGATVWCWGDGSAGQLGGSVRTNQVLPAVVAGLPTGAVTALSLGGSHACALVGAGTVACWGDNVHGQVGDGTFMTALAPRVVALGEAAVELAAGSVHMCARTASGRVYCWGGNAAGQLGDGTRMDRGAPTLVPLPGAATMVTAGGAMTTGGPVDATAHSCALVDGRVYCWGDNSAGQFGDGTTAAAATPRLMIAAEPVVEVRAGGAFTCVRVASGGVQCTGANARGQLGDGTTTSRTGLVSVRGVP